MRRQQNDKVTTNKMKRIGMAFQAFRSQAKHLLNFFVNKATYLSINVQSGNEFHCKQQYLISP